jgi:hypothetical protein
MTDNYWTWNADHLERSARWQERVDKRRGEAHKGRRSTRPIASYVTLDEIRDDLARLRAMPRDERPYAWSERRVDGRDAAGRIKPRRETWDPAPNEPARHLEHWLTALSRDAHNFIGPTAAAEMLHQLYTSPSGYRPDFAIADLGAHPAPAGAGGSSAAAHLTGIQWGATGTPRQAFARVAPRRGDKFTVHIKRNPDESS